MKQQLILTTRALALLEVHYLLLRLSAKPFIRPHLLQSFRVYVELMLQQINSPMLLEIIIMLQQNLLLLLIAINLKWA